MSKNSNNLTTGQQIRALFDQCVELSHDQQIAIIGQSSASKEVKEHVAKLLQFTTKDIELTQVVVDTVQVSLDIKPITPGMKIGAYKLIKPIGEGGQGEIWLAGRDDGDFNHQVAIKFLKPFHDHNELARFQGERELLAGLRHPNIAQLLDGGELGESRPYMVLEYVEGLPLLEYGRIKKFTLNQYLRCFLQICDAVSFAHSHSIIHRDIKPSNIYITDNGTVKLLDFGIAKFIDQDDRKTQTVPVMTLAYSSPEQVTGDAVSTATDVYTLGLLLYEMLTGQRAQAVANEAPAELMHEITHETPITPSQLIQTIDFDRSYGKKQLKGDLDNLILMAVRKEPERRYPSVEALANDIKNYLDGKPLVAVGDSWIYHVKKFISRNPVGTVLTSALLMFLVALPMTLYNHQNQLRLERDKAILAKQDALEQSTIANRTTDFLVNILESASPLGHQGEDISLDDVLENAERQLSVGLEEQPRIKATLLSKLASIQHHLGHSDQSVKHYQAVYQLYLQLNDQAGQAFALGQLAIMSHFANQEADVLSYKNQALRLTAQIKDPLKLAWHHTRIATIDIFLGKDQQAEERLMKSLVIVEDNDINEPELLGRIYNELSLASSDPNLRLSYIENATNYAKQLHGEMHPLYQGRAQNKAMKLKDLMRYQEAENLFLKTKDQTKKLFSTNHPMYSSVTAELGALYHDQGRFREVEKIYLEALEISERIEGSVGLNYVLQVNNLAYLYEDMGRYDQAEPLYRKSVNLRQQHHSANAMRVASSQSNLARLLAKVGKHEESARLLKQVIPIYQKSNRNNLYNEITALANLVKRHPNNQTCLENKLKFDQITEQLETVSEKSWRRMHAELWLGEMAASCHDFTAAEMLLSGALNKSKIIYASGSDGQHMIQQRVNQAKALFTEK